MCLQKSHEYLPGFTILLSAVCAIPLFAHAAPRVPGDASARGKDKVSVPPARLVTGDPAQINAVIAGTPPTAILAITPVQPPAAATPVNSYPPGCTIVGQELRCDRSDDAGFRAWFNVQVSGWDPAGNGPNAIAYQYMIFSSGYYHSDCLDLNPDNRCNGGPNDDLPCSFFLDCPGGSCGLDLKPAVVACSNDTICRDTFGESFAKCSDGFCDGGYLDADGTGRPDSFCAAPEACSNSGVAIGGIKFNYFAVSGSTLGTVDRGFVYHGGTLVLDIPAGAKGKYTSHLNPDETFIASPGTPLVNIPTLRESGFMVDLVTGSCCFGLDTPDAGCVDTCITRSDCNALPGPRVFTPGADCANPPTGDDCGDPETGACCDKRIADDTLRCRDDVTESGCVVDDPDQVSWYKFTRCADLPEPCLEHTGACCDADPFGTCQDNIPVSQCNCTKCLFYKDTPCSEIECLHNPIPTVSEWGLVVLTLLLLTAAKVYFGRRRSDVLSV